jgi:hypothetical protein
VFPAIFGTVVMTLVMTLAVVPFGVLAALYLREYAKAGPMVSAVRIAINNLAGVPEHRVRRLRPGLLLLHRRRHHRRMVLRGAAAQPRPSARAACCGPRSRWRC